MAAVGQIKKTGHGPRDQVRWLAPLPIWARPGPTGLQARDHALAARPAILRFDHDDFMTEFITTLQQEPQRLSEWLAQPETWRAPMARPAKTVVAAQPASKAAFLFARTRRLTAALKPTVAAALNLQPKPPQAPPAVSAASEEQLPLKLFQAGHNRHYLVSASLISEEAGLPDCEPEPGRNERAAFLVRRLLPPVDREAAHFSEWDEYAFVAGPRGNQWRRIGPRHSAAARNPAAGEEQLPLFPVSFTGSCGMRRRLLSGVIPVSRREAWVGAAIGGDVSVENTAPAGQAQPARSLPGLLFQADVAAPWKLLLERTEFKKNAAGRSFTNFGSDAQAENADGLRLRRTARDEIQTGSWYVLLDFASFLKSNLPTIWQALIGGQDEALLSVGEQQLIAVLRATTLPWELGRELLTVRYLFPYADWPTPSTLSGVTLSADIRYAAPHLAWNLADALVRAGQTKQGLEAVETEFIRYDDRGARLAIDANWPDFLFPLADPELSFPVPAVAASAVAGLTGLAKQQAAVDELARMTLALLPPAPPAEEVLDTVATGDQGGAAWFVLRCVYGRPQCGPMFTTLVSTATRAFQMAPFFDPDAPARPVRIPMPADISVAGLRRYQKNTGFVFSDLLCGKIKAIRKMTLADLVLSVLPWPFHKDLPNPGKSGPCEEGGTICSLSIPIVTLCALILMIIIVALFDLFFHWIPYLFICLPIPGLKGKAKSG